MTSHVPIAEQKFDRELLHSKTPVASHMPITEQNFDRELFNSETAVTSHMPDTEQYFDRELLNSKMPMAAHMPDAEQNFDINSKMTASSEMPVTKQYFDREPDTEQNFDRERLNSKMSMASNMPDTKQNFEIGSKLEAVITHKLSGGFMVELAPGITSLLCKSHMNDSDVCCILYLAHLHVHICTCRFNLKSGTK